MTKGPFSASASITTFVIRKYIRKRYLFNAYVKKTAQIPDGSLRMYIRLVRVKAVSDIAYNFTAGVRVHPGLPGLPVQG